MAEASRRAAAPAHRGGLANALFLVGAAEKLPGFLAARADHVVVSLPWGSLLRGFLSADTSLMAGITGLLKSGGELEMFSSAADVAAVVAALASHRLDIVDCRPAHESDAARLSSGWAKRLGIPHRHPAWLIRAVLRPGLAVSRPHAP